MVLLSECWDNFAFTVLIARKKMKKILKKFSLCDVRFKWEKKSVMTHYLFYHVPIKLKVILLKLDPRPSSISAHWSI